jgi:hypothetical protein
MMGDGLARPEGFVGRLEGATCVGKMHPNLIEGYFGLRARKFFTNIEVDVRVFQRIEGHKATMHSSPHSQKDCTERHRSHHSNNVLPG